MVAKWGANMKNYDKDKQKIHQENQSKAGTTVIHLCPLLKKDQFFVFGRLKKKFQTLNFKVLLTVQMLLRKYGLRSSTQQSLSKNHSPQPNRRRWYISEKFLDLLRKQNLKIYFFKFL